MPGSVAILAAAPERDGSRYAAKRWASAIVATTLAGIGTPSFAEDARRERLCDWAMREAITAPDAARVDRATFVAERLNCELVVDQRLEAVLTAGSVARHHEGQFGQAARPWPLQGLANLAMMLPGVAIVAVCFAAALAMLRWRRGRHRRAE